MSLKLVKHTLFAALALGLAGTANAGVSGSLTLTSDYLFRGFTQTNEKPAIQGGLEWSSEKSGFYAGTWGSSISWLDLGDDFSSQLELDGYVGFRGQFTDDFSYDVGVLYYGYPGDFPSGFNKADTTELYFGIGYGIFSLKYSYAVTDLFGIDDSDGSSYLDFGISKGFADDSWTISAHYGKQFISGAANSDYSDWSVGISKALPADFSLDLTYVDTDVDGADDAVYFAITKSF